MRRHEAITLAVGMAISFLRPAQPLASPDERTCRRTSAFKKDPPCPATPRSGCKSRRPDRPCKGTRLEVIGAALNDLLL